MILTPEERRALLLLIGLLFLGQALSIWDERRRSRPDQELESWVNRLARARADSSGTAWAESTLTEIRATGLGGLSGSMRTDAIAAGTGWSAKPSGPRQGWEADTVMVESSGAVPPGILETGRLRINQATASDLETLPGIGPALAGRILEDRFKNGPFRRPGDLLRIRGIGPKTLEKLRGRIDWAMEPDSGAVP